MQIKSISSIYKYLLIQEIRQFEKLETELEFFKYLLKKIL